MGLPYPGGVHLDELAEGGDNTLYKLPKPQVEGNELDFSFSGLKTAVINLIHNAEQKGTRLDFSSLAACVRKTVTDILLDRVDKAFRTVGYDKLVIAGGVSANSEIRERMGKYCKEHGKALYLPELKYCGDNAAMVGVQGYYEYLAGTRAELDLNAYATMDIATLK